MKEKGAAEDIAMVVSYLRRHAELHRDPAAAGIVVDHLTHATEVERLADAIEARHYLLNVLPLPEAMKKVPR